MLFVSDLHSILNFEGHTKGIFLLCFVTNVKK